MIGLLLAIWRIDLVRSIVSSIGLGRFVHYISGSISFSIGRFLLELPPLLLLIVNWKQIKKSKDAYFVLTYVLMNMIFSQINTMNVLAWRVSSYISCYSILVFPKLVPDRRKTRRTLSCWYLIVYGIVYWFYYFWIQNLHQTLPYVFK